MKYIILILPFFFLLIFCKSTQVEEKHAKERRIQFLFYANGGLKGFFSDGTISACPRCDLCTEAIETLIKNEPFRTYIIQEDGSLLLNNGSIEYPMIITETGLQEWAIIDYDTIVDIRSAYD